MRFILGFIIFITNIDVSAAEPASWHRIEKVTKVTVRNGIFYVRGEGVSGHSCTDEAGYYGTLNHLPSEPGHNEYYSMVLMAQASAKGLKCYVSAKRANGVCVMTNCHLI